MTILKHSNINKENKLYLPTLNNEYTYGRVVVYITKSCGLYKSMQFGVGENNIGATKMRNSIWSTLKLSIFLIFR